jgi:hypothetical protein
LSTAETASLPAIFPQIPFQFLCVKARRELEKVDESDRAGGQKPAFIEDLSTPVVMGRRRPCVAQYQKKTWPPAPHPKLILKLANPAVDGLHSLFPKGL